MENIAYFKILVEEIHSVVVATTDKNNLPTTRVIDMMLYDNNGIYFLTAKGKIFYEQLMEKSYLSLSGITAGAETMKRKAISIAGFVKNIGSEKREKIFAENPYMASIYPTIESRTALEVFCLYKGQGEYFDLSTKPITRASFSFGGKKLQQHGYYITDACNGCGICAEKCPQNCIEKNTPFKINQKHCLHCGICYEVCPEKHILKTGSDGFLQQ